MTGVTSGCDVAGCTLLYMYWSERESGVSCERVGAISIELRCRRGQQVPCSIASQHVAGVKYLYWYAPTSDASNHTALRRARKGIRWHRRYHATDLNFIPHNNSAQQAANLPSAAPLTQILCSCADSKTNIPSTGATQPSRRMHATPACAHQMAKCGQESRRGRDCDC